MSHPAQGYLYAAADQEEYRRGPILPKDGLSGCVGIALAGRPAAVARRVAEEGAGGRVGLALAGKSALALSGWAPLAGHFEIELEQVSLQ